MAKLNLGSAITCTLTGDGKAEKTYTITITADGIDKVFDFAAKEIAKEVAFPGFRPGKAPIDKVKTKYASYIEEEANRLANSEVGRIIVPEVQKYTLLQAPAFGEDSSRKVIKGEAYTVILTVPVQYDMELPDYKNFDLSVTAEKTLDERMATMKEQMKETYAAYNDITDAIQEKDMLQTAYTSDFALADDASASLKRAVSCDSAWMWINDPEQLPGVNAALIGKKVGDEFDFEATFPADWREEALRGKTVKYHMTVKKAQRKAVPGSDEELAKNMHMEKPEDLQNYLKNMAEMEEKNEVNQKKAEKIQSLLEPTFAAIEVPASMKASFVQRALTNIAMKIVKSQADVETFKANRAEHDKAAAEQGEKDLREYLVYRAIAAKENIMPTQQQFDAEIRNIAMYSGKKEQEIRKFLNDDEAQSLSMEIELIKRNVCNALIAPKAEEPAKAE